MSEKPPIDKTSNPMAAISSLLGAFSGKSTNLNVKPKSDEIRISIEGIEQKLALKHIRNLIEEMIHGD